MAEKKEESMWTRILFDYRVMALIAVLLLAGIFLFVYPHPTDGNLTNLKFGLDFEGGSRLKLMLVNNSTIPDDQLQLTKDIMANRINANGLKDIPINTVRDQDHAYMLIDFSGLTYDKAMDIVGSPGLFEMRIQSSGNESVHIIDGKDVIGESLYSKPTGTGETTWGVNFQLSLAGAQAFHDVAKQYDILNNPQDHQVIMLLDGKEFHRAPISTDHQAGREKPGRDADGGAGRHDDRVDGRGPDRPRRGL